MIPVNKIKTIGVDNTKNNLCPFALNSAEESFVTCQTSDCMAWFWTDDDTGCCALVYKPEMIELKK